MKLNDSRFQSLPMALTVTGGEEGEGLSMDLKKSNSQKVSSGDHLSIVYVPMGYWMFSSVQMTPPSGPYIIHFL